MSTGFPIDPWPTDFGATNETPTGLASAPAHSLGDATAFDPQLLQETKLQIRSIVNEIARLSQSDVPLDSFYGEFLTRVVSALAAVGGAVWTLDQDGRIQLKYQINLSETRVLEDDLARASHALLLKDAFADGHAELVPPRSGAFDPDEAGNPTDFLLVVAPLPLEDRVYAVVEVFQRPGGGPTTQRGYLRFVVQMCELAIDYLKNHRLRAYSDRQAMWDQLERFIFTIHKDLDLQSTAYAIANDGRLLLDCDRLSLATRRGRYWRIDAVSGLDAIDRRSREISSLTRLVDRALETRETMWLRDGADDVPPQLDSPLREYVNAAHAKLIGIIPLNSNRSAAEAELDRRKAEPIGALVIEQFRDDRPSHALATRCTMVAEHAQRAIANCVAHQGLLPPRLATILSRTGSANPARWLSRRIAAACATALVCAAVWFIPANLELPAEGQLLPSVRREIYAQVDGIVVDVPVKHGQRVIAGQVLARLRNTDVDVELSRLIGQQAILEQQLRSKEQELIRNHAPSPAERDRLAIETLDLRRESANVAEQLHIYRERERHLTVIADQPGQVVTWQVGTQLLRKPVREGEQLLTVVDPEGPWELELEVSERHVGHVLRAARAESDGLPIRFVLASHPSERLTGRLVEVQRTTESPGEHGQRVRMRVAINKNQLPELHHGLTVSAKVNCGRCSLGYSLLHDVLDTVRGKLLFWLT